MLIKKVKLGLTGQRICIGGESVIVDIRRCGDDGIRLAIHAPNQKISVEPHAESKPVE